MPPELVGPTKSGKAMLNRFPKIRKRNAPKSFPGVRSSEGCLPGKNPTRDSGDGAKVAGVS